MSNVNNNNFFSPTTFFKTRHNKNCAHKFFHGHFPLYHSTHIQTNTRIFLGCTWFFIHTYIKCGLHLHHSWSFVAKNFQSKYVCHTKWLLSLKQSFSSVSKCSKSEPQCLCMCVNILNIVQIITSSKKNIFYYTAVKGMYTDQQNSMQQ